MSLQNCRDRNCEKPRDKILKLLGGSRDVRATGVFRGFHGDRILEAAR
jgi:hypothetical protein